MATYRSFEELPCWQACRKLIQWASGILDKFPHDEKWDLKDNFRRALRSTTRNIAEGFGRFHFQENAQFCRIARGSLFEVKDDLITAFDEGYISLDDKEEGFRLVDQAFLSLNGYIKYLQNAK